MNPELARQIAELSGQFALIGAAIGAIGGLIGASIGAWNQRVMTRETELRHWRLDQIRPTVDMANRSFAHLHEIDRTFGQLWLAEDDNKLSAFQREVNLESGPLAHLGHTIVVARSGAEVLSKPLLRFMTTYQNCMNDVNMALNASLHARITDGPRPSLIPGDEHLGELLDAILALNQAVERYAFGRVGRPTLAEMEAEMSRSTRRHRVPLMWNWPWRGREERRRAAIPRSDAPSVERTQ